MYLLKFKTTKQNKYLLKQNINKIVHSNKLRLETKSFTKLVKGKFLLKNYYYHSWLQVVTK